MSNVHRFLRNYVYALSKCVQLFTIGTFSIKHRQIIPRMCSLFGDEKVQSAAVIPSVAIEAVASEETCIHIRQPMPVEGNVSTIEMIVLAKIVKQSSPQRLLEIGTFDGRTTLNMAANAHQDAVVYTLDLPKDQADSTVLRITPADRFFIDKDTSGTRYEDTDCADNIVQLYGDSATYDFTALNGTIDFVFIDGSHSYEYTLSDTNKAIRLLTNTGAIMWHDYMAWPGVTMALDELYKRGGIFNSLRHIEHTSLVYLPESK